MAAMLQRLSHESPLYVDEGPMMPIRLHTQKSVTSASTTPSNRSSCVAAGEHNSATSSGLMPLGPTLACSNVVGDASGFPSAYTSVSTYQYGDEDGEVDTVLGVAIRRGGMPAWRHIEHNDCGSLARRLNRVSVSTEVIQVAGTTTICVADEQFVPMALSNDCPRVASVITLAKLNEEGEETEFPL